MNWTCEQLEQRLNGYLEGKMAALELQTADEHARGCARCTEWFEARQARALLSQLEVLESPPGLETRILAHTLAPPEREGFWEMADNLWRTLLQPRVASGVAAAAFSLALVFTSLDVPLREVEAADLSPVNIYRALDRKAQLTYARGVRFFNELRVVYEIRNQFAEFQSGSDESEPSNPEDRTEGDDSNQLRRDRDERLSRSRSNLRSLAFSQMGVQRITR